MTNELMDERDHQIRQGLVSSMPPADDLAWSDVLAHVAARHVRRPLSRRRHVAIVVAGAAVILAAPAFALRSHLGFLFGDNVVVRAVSLPQLPAGWRSFSSAPDLLSPGGTHAETIVTSWRYRTDTVGGPASVMPADGTMISIRLMRAQSLGGHVNLCHDTPHSGVYPERNGALRLPQTTAATLEGAPRIKEYRIFGRFHDYYNFEVRVDVGPRGGRAALATATRIVGGIVFPPWPRDTHC